MPTRDENFPEWYQQILRGADLAENAPVRGAMIIKPWGYALWEKIQRYLDGEIKKSGCQNAYFPLFIPLKFLEKEAQHVEGFAKECAVITHTRLEEKDGKLQPASKLEEPYIVRPTSETIIGDAFSRWISSYRELPMKINQWANVVRWEMRPRLFLRTTEFLWQEGHTAHATEDEARYEASERLEMYRKMSEEIFAIPVITGEKSPGERFPGAENTYTFEMMMQDGKALQGGTSHYLGQNFSKAQDISFNTKDEKLEYAYTTSWGTTTRLIGALIMVHGDDDGIRLPPKIAPIQVVIVPVIPKAHFADDVLAYAKKIQESLPEDVSSHLDSRDMRGGDKNWEWIRKGVPVRIEVGPRDIEGGSAMIARRDRAPKEKEKIILEDISGAIPDLLEAIQQTLFNEAKVYLEKNVHTTITNFDELEKHFKKDGSGFVKAKWCGDAETEELLKPLSVTIRCLPFEQSGTSGTCVITGKPATMDAIFAKAY